MIMWLLNFCILVKYKLVLAISLDQLPGESEFIISIRQGSGYLLGSSSVCPAVRGSSHQVSALSLHKNLLNLCDTLAFAVLVLTEYNEGVLECWQWLSYSDVWGELALLLQKQKFSVSLCSTA